MKKILSMAVAIILAISMVACSNSSSTADTSGNSSSSASDSSEQGKDKDAPPDKPDGDKPDGKPDGEPGGGPGGSQSEVVYDAATEITKSQRDDNKTYETSDADKIALMISTSDEVTITDPTVKKSGDSDGGNGSGSRSDRGSPASERPQ
jgi:hypothetical protein